ncbi:MAG: HIT family protein [Deltaproteobacteria bacterium]|nr:HIT family protein [Deltaproteobacteria bacterium]
MLKTNNSELKTQRNLMQDCIFCRIVAGQLPAARVLETAGVLAFLDIAPVHYGHTLVIPKAHHQNLLDLPDGLWQEIGQVCRRVAQAIQLNLKAQGFNIGMNNFAAAGQEVFHAHVHVIPRYVGDGLKLFPQGSYKSGELEKMAYQLRQALENLTG